MTPIGVSKNGNLCAANGFGNLVSPETGAHCFEEGPFRGAFPDSCEKRLTASKQRRPMPQGQKTEPTSKLFDNQQIAAEISCDFSRESMTNSTDGTQDRPCITIGAYLHRRRFTSDS